MHVNPIRTLSGRFSTRLTCLLAVALLASSPCLARAHHTMVGSAPANPGPRAHLSGAMNPTDIRQAAAKVAAWQYERVEHRFNPHDNLSWTFAPLYLGFLDAAKLLHDQRYATYVSNVGKHFHWGLGPQKRNANDQSVAQAWLVLYAHHPNSAILGPLRKRFDQRLQKPYNPKRLLWWWADALFMGPPVWASLAETTHDRAYLDYMNHQWWITSALLYNTHAHLFSRDAAFLDKREPNGRKVFWSRGNGWVMAGLARILSYMPADYPSRPRYVRQFRQMAAELASIQGNNGMWRSGLLDAAAYPHPEVSGSALIIFAIAWGVHHHILGSTTYLPVIAKGWRGLVSQIYTSGRLGNIQPPAAAPGHYPPSSSYVYGVGAFLMAASEVNALAQGQGKERH